MGANDRRQFQRLRLSKPILATMGDQNSLILDVGMTGAFIEHYGVLSSGDRFHLKFRWHGEEVEYLCQVARSTVVRTPGGDGQSVVSHSGVRFVEAVGDSESRLQDMMAFFVGRILAAQKSNAAAHDDAEGALVLEQLGDARRTRSRGYITYRLYGNRWWREATKSSDQPDNGFTVAAHEDQDDLEVLCGAYENADDEGRRLIRLVAELSARSARVI